MKNLILTIGTNPLPCYKSCLYFLQNYSTIKNVIFLVSKYNDNINQSSTKNYAIKIIELLELKNNTIKFEIIEIDNISDNESISKSMTKLQITGDTHFDYTGGTKSMCVHSYDSLKLKVKFTSSYVDSRKNVLYLENLRTTDNEKIANFDSIEINFDTLIKLHGYTRKEKNKTFKDPEYLKNITNLLNNSKPDKDILKKFLKEIGSIITLCNEYYSFDPDTKKIVTNIIKSKIQNLKDDELMKNSKFNIELNNDVLSRGKSENISKELTEYEGKWLDFYIHNMIKDYLCLDKCEKIEPTEFFREDNKTDKSDFEIDSSLLYKSTYIGISCTTTVGKKDCKAKGFEVLYRSSQLGGDNSKSILITRLGDSEIKDLEKDLEKEIGADISSIKILGETQLFDTNELIKEIEAFIKSEKVIKND